MPVMGGVQAALLIRNCELGDERTVNEAQVAVYIVHTMRWNCLTELRWQEILRESRVALSVIAIAGSHLSKALGEPFVRLSIEAILIRGTRTCAGRQ